MPIFEYVCRQCNHQFEAIVMGKQKAPALNVRANSSVSSCPALPWEAKSRAQQLLPAARAAAAAILAVPALAG
jgi:hypothetical protein